MKAYGKSWPYNVYDCQYCLYWKGTAMGCTYSAGCCCPIPQQPKKRNGEVVIYPESEESGEPLTHCHGCLFGRCFPCIGWCTRELLKSIRHGEDI